MDYRSWIHHRIEARTKVVILMKGYFFADQPYSKVAMKMASWLTKLVHEGKKCWPDLEEREVCAWLEKQTADDLMEMILNPDDRPTKGMSPLARELKKYLPNTKDGDQCETRKAGI